MSEKTKLSIEEMIDLLEEKRKIESEGADLQRKINAAKNKVEYLQKELDYYMGDHHRSMMIQKHGDEADAVVQNDITEASEKLTEPENELNELKTKRTALVSRYRTIQAMMA